MIEIIGNLTRKAVDVTHKFALRTLAQAISPQFDATYKHAMAWTAYVEVTPTAADDYFFYLSNDGDLRDLVITRFSVDAGTAETIEVHHVTGTPGGGPTVVTPISRNLGYSPQLNATVYQDPDITGLTSSGLVERKKIGTTETHYIELMDRPIILGAGRPGNAIGVLAVTGAIAMQLAVDFMVQSVDPREFNM